MQFRYIFLYSLCTLILAITNPAQALIVEFLQELSALSEFNKQNRTAVYEGVMELFESASNQTPNFFSTKKTEPTEQDNSFTFADLAGDIPQDVIEIIEFIKEPERFTRVGAHMPHGILLYGPPGTGKTSIARAIAGESGAEFFHTSASEFVEMYVGVGPQRVRELFAKACGYKKAIIFIDEIDAIGGKRTGESNSEYRNTLNELLNQMDGFAAHNITVIAATNNIKALDPALLRPGRFDRLVKIDLPNRASRIKIIAHYCSKIAYKDSENIFYDLGHKSTGLSGAELKNMVNEAAVFAARENSNSVTANHLQQALNKILQQKHL